MSHPSEQNKSIPTLLQRDPKYRAKVQRIRMSRDFEYFGITETKSGQAPISLAFKITFRDGTSKAIQYHELISPFELESGGTKIVLQTSSFAIHIEGQELDDLFEYFMEHRIMWVKEPDSDFPKASEGNPQIARIQIVED